MTAVVFWLSLSGLVYVYLGYPLLVRGLAAVRPLRRLKALPVVDQKVSIVLASFNESPKLELKLRDLLSSPQAKYVGEILIGSDGSTDDTAEMVTRFNDPRLRLFRFAERRGKPAILNNLIPRAVHDIVLLCDARQILSENAIPELLANFADPAVGVVSGELMFRSPNGSTTASNGISAYWRYEKMIRRSEAQFRSVPGATGALYAIRKSLFDPIPVETLLDDVVIPMQAIAKGARCVFEPAAIAWDEPSSTLQKEAIRKRRTIAGAAQLVKNHAAWMLPWKNPIWFEFVSHKVLRLTSPLLLLALMISHSMLAFEPGYRVLMAAHIGFYVSAFIGWVMQRRGCSSLLFGVQLMFLTLNATTVAALWDALRGRFRVTWQRT